MFAREISYICDWAKTPRKINSSLNCDYPYSNGTNRHKVELSENQPQKQSENGRSTQRHHIGVIRGGHMLRNMKRIESADK